MGMKEDISTVGHLAAELAERLEKLCNVEFEGNNGTTPEDYDAPPYYVTSPLRFKEISTRADQLYEILQRSPEIADALAAVNPNGVVVSQQLAECVADADRLTTVENELRRKWAEEDGREFRPKSAEDTKKRITSRSYAEAVVELARMAVAEIEHYGPRADFFTIYWGTKRHCELETEAAIAEVTGEAGRTIASLNGDPRKSTLNILSHPMAIAIEAVAQSLSVDANGANPERTPDTKADSKKKSGALVSESADVNKLILEVSRNKNRQRNPTDIARELADGDETKAQSLLRSRRRIVKRQTPDQ